MSPERLGWLDLTGGRPGREASEGQPLSSQGRIQPVLQPLQRAPHPHGYNGTGGGTGGAGAVRRSSLAGDNPEEPGW